MADDIELVHRAQVVLDKKAALRRLAEVEHAVQQNSFDVVDAVVSFAEINPEQEEPPQNWIEKYGYLKALHRFRIAKAGWMSAKDAPVAIKVAASIATNALKNRGEENRQPLNMTLVKVVSNTHKYETMEIEEK